MVEFGAVIAGDAAASATMTSATVTVLLAAY
jgi:hypothetical protein